MYCGKTIVFGKLLMMDCPKHSLESTALWDCLDGRIQSFCSSWSGKIRPSVGRGRGINNTNIVLSDEQQKRTLGTVTNQKNASSLVFFYKFTFCQPNKFFPGGPFGP